jgi:endopeptidase Clp ATP-binding regulatory subunit ClpX
MNSIDEKTPNPKELEKEISEFLTKKFGDNVKIVSPIVMPQRAATDTVETPPIKLEPIQFDLKPEELIAYLDHYIIKQDHAKAVLATKICTHFNRIKHFQNTSNQISDMVGSIKNNVLMIGPTGVGKTYMIKLIAKKLGVPFVKGDATKFSETGYVGGDVEDLVRDLVREADGDIEKAQYGIIYIDEIDKIASSRNLVGADVSRTGVQRALLKPMEETEVDLKVPHDPISMIQEIERFRKTGQREDSNVNTKHILFIMSGAFTDLSEIIHKRITDQGIGFGAQVRKTALQSGLLQQVASEDLIKFGFESEFVGRLPVRAVFEELSENDLYQILKNPNNPIILGKKLDFAAYGISIKFNDHSLKLLAELAFKENTGARGLVSAVEQALLLYERKLPSTSINLFSVTQATVEAPEDSLAQLTAPHASENIQRTFEQVAAEEKSSICQYIHRNRKSFSEKYGMSLTPSRIETAANLYAKNILDIGQVIEKMKLYYDEIKKLELLFIQNHDINIILEEEAINFAIEQFGDGVTTPDDFYQKLTQDFELGLKLIHEKTGKNRFFITKAALENPNEYLDSVVRNELKSSVPPQ